MMEISRSHFSPCRSYRYSLDRIWNSHDPSVLFILFNPSTADETKDDPTLRRCIQFAKNWGYGGLRIVNLYSLRSSNPKRVTLHNAPKGPYHHYQFYQSLRDFRDVVCAWGLNGGPIPSSFFTDSHQVFYLGLNKDGSPKHPLYLPASAELLRWSRMNPNLQVLPVEGY